MRQFTVGDKNITPANKRYIAENARLRLNRQCRNAAASRASNNIVNILSSDAYYGIRKILVFISNKRQITAGVKFYS